MYVYIYVYKVYMHIFKVVYVYIYIHSQVHVKCSKYFPVRKLHTRYSSTITGLEWPRGFQEVKVPRLHDNGTGWW